LVIPGIRTPEQVAMNTKFLLTLEESDKQLLAELYSQDWQPVMEMMEKLG
jgi:hypothetical protein